MNSLRLTPGGGKVVEAVDFGVEVEVEAEAEVEAERNAPKL